MVKHGCLHMVILDTLGHIYYTNIYIYCSIVYIYIYTSIWLLMTVDSICTHQVVTHELYLSLFIIIVHPR